MTIQFRTLLGTLGWVPAGACPSFPMTTTVVGGGGGGAGAGGNTAAETAPPPGVGVGGGGSRGSRIPKSSSGVPVLVQRHLAFIFSRQILRRIIF